MGFFSKLMGGSKEVKTPKGFTATEVTGVESIGADTVKITFAPSTDRSLQKFIPGQYIVIAININDKEHRRSYSICSGENEPLAIAVKKVKNGIVSSYLNDSLKAGDVLAINKPEGSFLIPSSAEKIVLIAAGSGITPMMSFMKSRNANSSSISFFYGVRTANDVLFQNELNDLSNVNKTIYLSQAEEAGFEKGRLSKENFSNELKKNLDLLKSDTFMLCGPESMIHDLSTLLESFGVPKNKIHFELFTVETKNEAKKVIPQSFEGNVSATIIIDGESESMEIKPGKVVLEAAIDEGMDAPYSCKGGVCSTCKGKIIKGSATMKMNYSLTDKEVEEGFILTCQAVPTSKEITITYDV